MLAWHLGGTLFLFRWIFRDPRVDVRFLLAGALLPDGVDLLVGTVFAADRYSSGSLWLHSLAVPSLLGLLILVVTRRGERRRQWLAVVIGMFFHVLLDGMWTNTAVFLWPLAGPLPTGPRPYWTGLIDRALADPWRWIREGIGLVYLRTLWKQTGLGSAAVRSEVWRTGRLPGPSG
jgi:hypothetical protein